MKFTIGKAEGKDVKVDLGRLIETGLLLTASSGGGKSMTLRTFLENSHGEVPQIVLDVEGEFSTLREKYDYVLAGTGGDIPADPRTAPMFARKVLEHNLSTIIDLSELKHVDKHRFVHLFLDALVNAPREYWGPRLLVIDEAHQFCPEKASGVSEAWEAVIDCCEKGRKRGIRPLMATQRLSKLHKDAAAECQNKIIGLGNLDIDRERSARELGFTHKEDILSLRDLEPGEFYLVGPAISRQVIKAKINEAQTSHPKIGKRVIKAPVATAKVKALLEKLKDIPQEVEQEAKTIADFKTVNQKLNVRVKELEQQLKAQPAVPVKKLSDEEIKRVRAEYQKQVQRLTAEFDRRRGAEMKKAFQALNAGLERELKQLYKDFAFDVPTPVPELLTVTTHPPIHQMAPKTQAAVKEMVVKAAQRETKPADPGSITFGQCERKIMGFLGLNPDRTWTALQVAVGTGYSWKSGGFKNALSKLRTAGAITGVNDGLQVADLSVCSAITPSGDYLNAWKNNLGKCENAIWDYILLDKNTVLSLEALGTATGYSPSSGGFKNAVSRLSSLGLIIRKNGGIQLNPEVGR